VQVEQKYRHLRGSKNIQENSIESIKYLSYVITFIWLSNLHIETKGYKKTEASEDEIRKNTKPQKKWRHLRRI